jgi:hypothetical protein
MFPKLSAQVAKCIDIQVHTVLESEQDKCTLFLAIHLVCMSNEVN